MGKCATNSSVLSCLYVFRLLLVFSSVFSQAQTTQGQWSPLETWPTRAIHTSLLPDGRVLFYSDYDEALQPHIWDPATDTFAPTAAAPYSLFCSGHTTMADGRIFIAGGHIADFTGYAHALIYDPFNNTMTQVPDMNEGRWYPTTTVLGNGDILVVSGEVNSNAVVDPLPQVFQVASGTWRDLTSAQLLQDLYPVMLVAPNGQVVNAGPQPQTRSLDTSGTGAWTNLATTQFGASRDYGPGLMYETGKILEVGGGTPPTATAETLDLNAAAPSWTFTGNMHFARRQHNAVILPDGKVFVVGGSSGSKFDDSANPVLPTEMWDPATGQFTVMASIAVYRGYHSTALLLPDGRVLSAGGNVGGANAQLYSPPYLFAGPRPSISSGPTSVGYGATIFIGTPDAAKISKIAWVRTSSTTHTFDEGGRFMHLSFTQTTGGLNVTMPANGNLAPPGYYMLFLLDSSGVPSVAKIIQITQNGGATGTLTGSVTNTSSAPLNGAQITTDSGISASTAPDGTYTLNNIPAGPTTVTAALSGYQSASQSVTTAAGNTTSVPSIQLAPVNPGKITGSVVDGNGTAIAGATVNGAGLTAITDGNGAYTLGNVPAGSVALNASANGFQPASETVTVTAGNTTAAPAMALLSNNGNVTGKVVDSSNNAIGGATVSFGGGTATTDANGIYNFTNLPPGTIQLVASATGFQSVTQNVSVVAGTTTTANFTLPTALRYVAATPCRIADTRNPNGPFGGPFMSGGSTRSFEIPKSACGIPATAQAYSVNVTVVPKAKLAYLTMFPCGQTQPFVSTLNSDHRVKAAAAIVPAGTNGAVCIYVTDDTDVVLDIDGYFVPSANTSALAFFPITPCRMVDTRNAPGPLDGPSLQGNGPGRSFPLLSSSCNVPATAQAYSLNFTSVPNGGLDYLTTWPTGQLQPSVSTLNAPTGAITANAAIVAAGSNGAISVFVSNDSDLVIDVNGYFAPPGPGGLSLYNLPPCRVVDTRIPAGSPPFKGTRDVNVAASGCGAPVSAQAYVVNATVVPSGVLGYLTLWPQGAPQPLVSTLNANDGAITSNMAIVPTSNGSISAFAQDPTQLVVDLFGYFAP
ncbi:MAG TPA: carboxypeptidase regulatory-like domain-containing protein [Candidatus Angelobacter sp.]|nr:carboxypeptidase regulatory-like domain-containing protein [Candidatus Angelobacter sp.]